MADEGKTWAEWSIHVLKELERLNNNLEDLNNRVNEVEQHLITMQATHVDINTIRSLLDQTMAPISTKLSEITGDNVRLKQTLYGVKENNGLVGDMRALTEDVKKLDTFKTKLVATFVVIQIILTIAGEAVVLLLTGKHG